MRMELGKAFNWEHYRSFMDLVKEHQSEMDLSYPKYEPSINVINDPENHPIIKKPLRKQEEEEKQLSCWNTMV